MFRLVISIIIIAISIVGFSAFTVPLYEDLSKERAQAAAFSQALDNAKALENERDKLVNKYNSIKSENLDKLEKLLPDNVDNIRLILEIEKIALPHGMVLKDVKYDSVKKNDAQTQGAPIPAGSTAAQAMNKEYGQWNLEFSTQGTYNNFLNFVQDLESNLRIVDVSSIVFTSNVGSGLNPSFAEAYKYGFKIKTYWLKN